MENEAFGGKPVIAKYVVDKLEYLGDPTEH
jgi:hypothetical protein